jgi:hypothetical protein
VRSSFASQFQVELKTKNMMKKIITGLLGLLAIGTFQSSAQNYSIQLNGATQYVDLDNTVGNGVKSIDLWFNPSVDISGGSLSDNAYLVGRHTPSGNDEFGLYFASGTGSLVFYVRNGTTTASITTNGPWANGVWRHVTAMIDPSAGLQIYLESILMTPWNIPPFLATASSTEITTIGCYGNAHNKFFPGRMENVRFWNKVLNSSERHDFPCSTIGTTTGTSSTGLIAEYLFNEQSTGGLTARDETSAHNGTYVNAPLQVIDCPCSLVMDFKPAEHDWVSIPANVATGTRTIELWFRPHVLINNALGTHQSLIVRNDLGEHEEFGLYFQAGLGQLIFFTRLGGAPFTVPSGIAWNSWNANQWYHVTAIIDPVIGMQLYINSTLCGTNGGRVASIQPHGEVTALGAWGDEAVAGAFPRWFDGSIENVRLWDHALTVAEFTNNMCNPPVNNIGLLAEYRFNESDGRANYDQNQTWPIVNDATVIGASWIQIFLPTNCLSPDRIANEQETVQEMKPALIQNSLMIFPNPSEGVFAVVPGPDMMDKNITIEVYDMTGKMIRSQKGNGADKLEIDLTKEPNGIYFVKVSDGTVVSTGKVVIQ